MLWVALYLCGCTIGYHQYVWLERGQKCTVFYMSDYGKLITTEIKAPKLTPPSFREFIDFDTINSMDDLKAVFAEMGMAVEEIHSKKKIRVTFTETKFEVTGDPEGNGQNYKFSIWVPDVPLGNYIALGKPTLITGNMIMLARELLGSM